MPLIPRRNFLTQNINILIKGKLRFEFVKAGGRVSIQCPKGTKKRIKILWATLPHQSLGVTVQCCFLGGCVLGTLAVSPEKTAGFKPGRKVTEKTSSR